jgi:hypothetical protein
MLSLNLLLYLENRIDVSVLYMPLYADKRERERERESQLDSIFYKSGLLDYL